eukprot:gnl/TRDRNA2_/TRDRNA2_66499_c0_seq1.p1 gnl/TRDRNA2_/TRDRNA2_66499_c0~~gnl/TRDRNA2_/TRDRNA2_66499_c0_seq1.p1  ORF type:complete len:289 (+),score=41.49 gnl/TRDRNA2_/TRDRNA2_66499_c0_seq1:40-906(+)
MMHGGGATMTANAQSVAETFFKQLPQDKLLPQESELIIALERLAVLVPSLLPRSVTLQAWAERRIGRDLAEKVNNSGVVYIPPRSSVVTLKKATGSQAVAAATMISGPKPPSGNQFGQPRSAQLQPGTPPVATTRVGNVAIAKGKGKGGGSNVTTMPRQNVAGYSQSHAPASVNHKAEEFFASLPQDAFSDAEIGLRDALCQFLLDWQEQAPPRLDEATKDPLIVEARHALLDGKGVSLKEWCERRMGEEISFTKVPSGPYTFGLVGPSGDWLQKEREERGMKRLRTS